MYGVIQTSNSWSKYPYLLFSSSLFFLIFRAFIVEFLICDLVEIWLRFCWEFLVLGQRIILHGHHLIHYSHEQLLISVSEHQEIK
jgi:hypothetical protein